jgi:hypothetical protein
MGMEQKLTITKFTVFYWALNYITYSNYNWLSLKHRFLLQIFSSICFSSAPRFCNFAIFLRKFGRLGPSLVSATLAIRSVNDTDESHGSRFKLVASSLILNRGIFGVFYVLYSTLLRLPPPILHCVG